ncbi:MAG: hypothetical protein BWX87_02511 [Bacteroidetes bacterium ADurb.Bin123]|nr:MAG: hypothetical protein BWX87_02511 [Bacteroidetes bacterium ADurb.Bin123]
MRLVITPLASVAGVFDLAYVLEFINNFCKHSVNHVIF